MVEPVEQLRVFLVDDHPGVRSGVRNVLEAGGDVTVVGEADGVMDGFCSALAMQPHVMLVDVRLRDGNGVDLCRAILSGAPEIACVLLTSHSEDEALIEATLAGAMGYALKQVRGGGLIETVRAAGTGADLVSSDVRRRVVDHLIAVTPDLDDTEMELLRMIGQRMSDADIAPIIGLTPLAARAHVQELLGRLGVDRATPVNEVPTSG